MSVGQGTLVSARKLSELRNDAQVSSKAALTARRR